MSKSGVTRRQLLIAAAPAVAAVPFAKLALGEAATASGAPVHAGMAMDAIGHAAMIGDDVPAPGGPKRMRFNAPPILSKVLDRFPKSVTRFSDEKRSRFKV